PSLQASGRVGRNPARRVAGPRPAPHLRCVADRARPPPRGGQGLPRALLDPRDVRQVRAPVPEGTGGACRLARRGIRGLSDGTETERGWFGTAPTRAAGH